MIAAPATARALIGCREALHQVAHDNRQLNGNLSQQLRVTFVRRYHVRERQDNPATGDAAAAVAEAHRVVVHGQYYRRDVG